MDDLGQFLFLAAGSVSLFAYLSVVHWVNAQSEERMTRHRLDLMRKVAEQPVDSAKVVIDLLREEQARALAKERKTDTQTRRNGMQTGAILVALGLGISIAFAVISRKAWALGLIPLLTGLVVLGFAAFSPVDDRASGSTAQNR